MIEQGFHTSITGRSLENGTLTLHAVNIRDYTINKHKKVDDYPYGGGAGMLMQAQPVYDAYQADDGDIPEIDLPKPSNKSYEIPSELPVSTEPLPESERPRKDGPGGEGLQ